VNTSPPQPQQGFSLIEITTAVVIIGILAVLTIWHLTGPKNDADSVSKNQSLDVVQQVEQLAKAYHLTLTNNTALQRIIEMQAKLAANGCVTHVLDPTNLADVVTFSGTNWTLR
jgi:prepilin-type N-terminal cleavage/methylation domain-containing protein